MSTTLNLPSGLIIRDPVGMLKQKFKQWPWAKYDGVRVKDPNRIGEADIDSVYRLGARTPRKAYQSLVAQHGNEIYRCLAAIPQECTREGEEPPLSNLRQAFAI